MFKFLWNLTPPTTKKVMPTSCFVLSKWFESSTLLPYIPLYCNPFEEVPSSSLIEFSCCPCEWDSSKSDPLLCVTIWLDFSLKSSISPSSSSPFLSNTNPLELGLAHLYKLEIFVVTWPQTSFIIQGKYVDAWCATFPLVWSLPSCSCAFLSGSNLIQLGPTCSYIFETFVVTSFQTCFIILGNLHVNFMTDKCLQFFVN